MNERTKALYDAGVSIWLDDLSRQRIESGNLDDMINNYSVVGVTTNPTIFAAAFSDLSLYGDDLASLKDAPLDDALRQLMASDVAAACKIFRPIYDATNGVDGRVSIEVEPGLAMDAEGTLAQAKVLHELVGEPNVLIKIPATVPGLEAIQAATAAGISVNVTLIFSIDRYLKVMEAYISGLEQAADAGLDLSEIHSVASFFVSRVDSEIDAQLDAIGTPEALELRGKAAVANARLAYDAFAKVFTGARFQALADKGANVQRPLWASTGVKNPDYPDTLYVDELVAPNTVNTMPEKTLMAVADHGEVRSPDVITPTIDDAQATMDALAEVGIDYDQVVEKLETEGVDKFNVSWDELVASVTDALQKS